MKDKDAKLLEEAYEQVNEFNVGMMNMGRGVARAAKSSQGPSDDTIGQGTKFKTLDEVINYLEQNGYAIKVDDVKQKFTGFTATSSIDVPSNYADKNPVRISKTPLGGYTVQEVKKNGW